MRLIDADALLKDLGVTDIDCEKCALGVPVGNGLSKALIGCGRGFDFVNVCLAIDDAPTIDAVEVVRCKDCAIRFDACPMVVRVRNFIQIFTEDEDFCSRGRRENDEH